MSILLGSIDNIEPSDTSLMGRVFVQKTIESTVNCNIKQAMNNSVCCQSLRIDITLPTQLLQQVNAFGVEFPNQTLLEYSNDSQNNIVETFVGTSLDFRGFVNTDDQEPVLMLQANGYFMDLSLRYLRLVIEESISPNSGRMNLNAIIVTILPITIGVMITLLLIVSVIMFAIHRQKRRKNIITEQEEGISIATCIYDNFFYCYCA
jgi:hypothetical protein